MPRSILPYLENAENVVWDWNGTLLDDLDVVFKAEAAHFPKYGIAAPSLERRNEIFCFPIKTYYERLGFNFSEQSFEEINKDFLSVYEAMLADAPLFAGMRELLQEIKALGKKQFVLSAAPQKHLEELLGSHELSSVFKGIYGLPHTNADSKINRGRELIEEHSLDPSKTLMIGDTDHDFEVGKALGFQVLLLADGHRPYEALKNVHHQVLKTRY